MSYEPRPVDTSGVSLGSDLQELTELLAQNAHDIWARQRLQDGWTWGSERDDTTKKHPCLVPYAELPDSEKVYDRNTAMETIKVLLSLGYRLQRHGSGEGGAEDPAPR